MLNEAGSNGDVSGDDAESTRGILGAALAVTAWGSVSVLAKAIDMGGVAIAVYRFLLYFLIVIVWMVLRRQPVRRRLFTGTLFGGVALAFDVAFFFTALKETSVMNATLIGALQPIVVGVVAARFFGERIRTRDAAWSLLALVGVAVVVLASSDSAVSSTKGDLLAVCALFSWSGYFIASRQSRGVVSSTEFTAGSGFWAGALNVPLAVLLGQDLSPPAGQDLVLLLTMTVVAGVIGHSLMNWSLVRIPLWLGSTFTLFIPVAASFGAWLLLDEPLTWIQVAGTAVVLAALAAIVIGQARPGSSTPSPGRTPSLPPAALSDSAARSQPST